MALIYFVTHPRSEVTPSVPMNKWQLSDQGLIEARRLLDLPWWQDVQELYSSPEPKALTVAQMVEVKYNLDVSIEECLRELDRKGDSVLEYDDFIAASKQVYTTPSESVRGWETAYDAADRIFRCITSSVKKSPDTVFAIISHPMIGGLFHSHINQSEPDYEQDDPKGTARFFVVNFEERRIIQD
ncbi:MAG: hypothetical protein COW24_00875, partial [Candidatus Kerfeldbacteria bacterium CG15_BIG_FIL_POST_REV_8_21_14_020_45_12]